ncbi:MAG: very short patch repair endonuclease [Solirubrobacteraceae bacterium]
MIGARRNGLAEAADVSVPPAPKSTSAGVRRSMQSNRRSGTNPERGLRSALHAAGWRFRIDLPIETPDGRVRPDIVFTRLKLAVFVDGCFWHGCPEHGVSPKSNESYWGPKLRRNAQRDRRDAERLEAAGWTVLRIWEHEPTEDALRAVVRVLSDAVAPSPRRRVRMAVPPAEAPPSARQARHDAAAINGSPS